MKTEKVPKLRLQWLGSVDQGKQLELLAADAHGDENTELPYALATVRADESTEELLLELYIDKIAIQIPVSEVEAAFKLAVGEVHSERWYEENVYSDFEEKDK